MKLKMWLLFLFTHNMGQVSFSVILLPLVSALGFVVLAVLLLMVLLRNSQKAGVIISLSLVLFFSYGQDSYVYLCFCG